MMHAKAITCAHCGALMAPEDRRCGSCGAPVRPEERASSQLVAGIPIAPHAPSPLGPPIAEAAPSAPAEQEALPAVRRAGYRPVVLPPPAEALRFAWGCALAAALCVLLCAGVVTLAIRLVLTH
jgi:hypothetical protein